MTSQKVVDDSLVLSNDEDIVCPLCMEELDISDKNFKPCECGYQVCRFCWNHIRTELSGRCPACRRPYSEQNVQWKPVTAEEWKMDQHRKIMRKQTDKEKKDADTINKKNLANSRVIQRNLVYVSGLTAKNVNDDLISTLRSPEFFGQYGKISKLVVNRKSSSTGNSLGIFITYVRKEDAARAIAAIDGSHNDGKILRASYGTTKYCTSYLRNQPCPNPSCMYLHEPGEEVENVSKADLSNSPSLAKSALAKASIKNKAPLLETNGISHEIDTEDDASAPWANNIRSLGGSSGQCADLVQSKLPVNSLSLGRHTGDSPLHYSKCQISASHPESLTENAFRLFDSNKQVLFENSSVDKKESQSANKTEKSPLYLFKWDWDGIRWTSSNSNDQDATASHNNDHSVDSENNRHGPVKTAGSKRYPLDLASYSAKATGPQIFVAT